MQKVLIAGATGYLGGYVVAEFKKQSYFTRVIVRNIEKFSDKNIKADEVIQAEVTRPDTLRNCCEGMDVVFSSIGITMQKDGLTYMDVDYQANLNLLHEAIRCGVKKFIYVSVLNGPQMSRVKLCIAKEKFVEALKNSGLDYSIIRPTGYFSDMAEFFHMAKKGRLFLLGEGGHKMNPISGEDLAKVCVASVNNPEKEVPVGGPESFTYNEIARLAFAICEKKPRIIHIPGMIVQLIIRALRLFTSSKVYGPVEFFIAVLSRDMQAPQYGTNFLKKYFVRLKKAS